MTNITEVELSLLEEIAKTIGYEANKLRKHLHLVGTEEAKAEYNEVANRHWAIIQEIRRRRNETKLA